MKTFPLLQWLATPHLTHLNLQYEFTPPQTHPRDTGYHEMNLCSSVKGPRPSLHGPHESVMPQTWKWQSCIIKLLKTHVWNGLWMLLPHVRGRWDGSARPGVYVDNSDVFKVIRSWKSICFCGKDVITSSNEMAFFVCLWRVWYYPVYCQRGQSIRCQNRRQTSWCQSFIIITFLNTLSVQLLLALHSPW